MGKRRSLGTLMRILIAGGFGFVGGRLAKHFHRIGHQVVLGSRNANGPPGWLPQTEVATIDWDDSHALERICSGVDVVVHAAGMNAQECAADPVSALKFNGLATARLMEAASEAGVKRFIYFSTAHVYANPLTGTIDENTCPRNSHPYASSHQAGENAVFGVSQRGGTQGIVLRLSNAYGAPMHAGANCWMLLANDLCKQAVERRQIVLQTSGLQQRDFIPLEEVCRITECLIARSFDAAVPSAINIGSGASKSVLEMAQLIQRRCEFILNFRPKLKRVETAAEEQHQTLEYRSNVLKQLGVGSRVDNETEIDRLLAFCLASFNAAPTGCL